MGFGKVTSAASSGAGVAGGVGSTAQSTASSQAYLAMMAQQNNEAMANSRATALMSKEQGENNALCKFIKSIGDNVKGLAP